MSTEYRPVSDLIRQRRSIRRFLPDPVPPLLVYDLVELACTAPAPHGSKPWRFVYVAFSDAKARLADAMASAWLMELVKGEMPVLEVDRVIKRSRRQISDAPVLLLACLTDQDANEWPDEQRSRGERDMFVQSLGAALQNILLAASERGLSGYLKGAPMFCAPAVREALDLNPTWEPMFLVLLGYPDPAVIPVERERFDLDRFLIER
ncbi:MAG: nitroreductase family protein [Dehalococcoidia bacterium]